MKEVLRICFYSVSNTAEYGAYVSGPKVVDERTRDVMKSLLADIQSGDFAKRWMEENAQGQKNFKAARGEMEKHPIEDVGKKLRGMMPWISKARLVDRQKN